MLAKVSVSGMVLVSLSGSIALMAWQRGGQDLFHLVPRETMNKIVCEDLCLSGKQWTLSNRRS